jgi:hypothetical protein
MSSEFSWGSCITDYIFSSSLLIFIVPIIIIVIVMWVCKIFDFNVIIPKKKRKIKIPKIKRKRNNNRGETGYKWELEEDNSHVTNNAHNINYNTKNMYN